MRRLYLAIEHNPIVTSSAWLVDKAWSHLILPSLKLTVFSFLLGLALSLVIGSGLILGFLDLTALAEWATSLRKF